MRGSEVCCSCVASGKRGNIRTRRACLSTWKGEDWLLPGCVATKMSFIRSTASAHPTRLGDLSCDSGSPLTG